MTMAHRMKLTFKDHEAAHVNKWLKREFPYLPAATALKLAVLSLCNGDENQEAGTAGDCQAPRVTTRDQKAPRVTCPGPTRADAPAPVSESSQKKSKRREEKIPPIVPPLPKKGPNARQVAEAVIGRMNEIRQWKIGARRGWSSTTWTETIGALLAKGFGQADMLEVVEWKAGECERVGDWQWFKPDTLFRPTLFAAKLDNARAGVEHGPQARTQADKRRAQLKRRAEQTYQDNWR